MKISNLINDEVQNKWSRYMKKVYSLASENRVAYVIVHQDIMYINQKKNLLAYLGAVTL